MVTGMNRWLALAALALCFAAPVAQAKKKQAAGAAQTQTQTQTWTYDGPYGALRWDKLNPDWRVCATGKQQSPINIHKVRLNKSLPPLEFHYMSGPMKLVNDGHTVRVTPPDGSYLTVGGTRYDLVEFHFHHPGEEVIGGQLSDMSVQFVHRSAQGKTLIVAVEMNEGDANTILAGLWEQLPKTTGASGATKLMLNPDGLLPTDRGYWTYAGSLTEPPCTEGVQWYVLQQPITLSRWQLNAFAALFQRNDRPDQPAHSRRVYASE